MEKPTTMEIVAPHTKVSRDVLPEEYDRVREIAKDMLYFTVHGNGDHKAGYAVAHAQVEDKDPMRFFVLRLGVIIVNPVITRHTKHLDMKEEGCLSYPFEGMTTVGRYYRCEVQYTEIIGDTVTRQKNELKGLMAQIFQHEIDHMDGITIYTKS